ncbi:MAG: hypothetical protein D6707_07955, partial [Bacteroidetes bacterium]
TYDQSGTYDIILTAYSEDGCKNTIIQQGAITVYPAPDADFIADPEEALLTNPLVNFDATPTTNVTDSLYINWNFDDGSLSEENVFVVEHVFPDTGHYDVSLIAINEYGCIDTATHQVYIKADYALYTPNAFTPNNDGINDTFFPDGVGIAFEDGKFKFMVFDRWGELIFQSSSRSNPWDGIAHEKGGKEVVKEGVYVWKVIAETYDGKNITQKDAQVAGIVTVIK